MELLTARSKVGEALHALCCDYPLFANIALAWNVVENADFDTMATNGPTLFYSASFVESLTIAETEWVLLHEAGHIFLGHHLRLLGVNPDESNEAFDLALNSLIREHCPSERLRKMVLIPGQGRYAKLPLDMDAEYYHATLYPPTSTPPPQPEQSEQESGNAQDASEGQAEGSDSASDSKSEGSKQRPPKGLGGVLPAPKTETAEERAESEAQWKETVAEGIAIAEQCGKLPGWMKDIGEKLLGKSEIDWRTILRRFLIKTVPQGMSYTRPNRRSAYRTDFRLPARRAKGGADGLIIADTSGSIFDLIKDKVLPELDKILRTLSKSSVRLLQIDTSISADETYTRWDLPLKLDVMGGGGTDLSPAFAEAKGSRELRWCVVITDMQWHYQSAPNPGIPTLWIVVDNAEWKGKPPFGELVKVQ